MPPVSVTMQPRNLPAAEALELEELEELGELELDEVVLEPQAAANRAVAATAAVVISFPFTGTSSAGAACGWLPGRDAGSSAAPAGRGA